MDKSLNLFGLQFSRMISYFLNLSPINIFSSLYLINRVVLVTEKICKYVFPNWTQYLLVPRGSYEYRYKHTASFLFI